MLKIRTRGKNRSSLIKYRTPIVRPIPRSIKKKLFPIYIYPFLFFSFIFFIFRQFFVKLFSSRYNDIVSNIVPSTIYHNKSRNTITTLYGTSI